MPQTNLFSRNKFDAKGKWFCRRVRAIQEVKCCSSCTYHPSILEAKTAKIIDSLIPSDNWKSHVPFLIKPATSRYGELTWKADFHIFPTLNKERIPRLIVETKGMATPDFLRNLQYLDYFNGYAFEQVLIVGNQAKKIDNHFTQLTVSQFELKLKCLLLEAGYLKQ